MLSSYGFCFIRTQLVNQINTLSMIMDILNSLWIVGINQRHCPHEITAHYHREDSKDNSNVTTYFHIFATSSQWQCVRHVTMGLYIFHEIIHLCERFIWSHWQNVTTKSLKYDLLLNRPTNENNQCTVVGIPWACLNIIKLFNLLGLRRNK